MKMEGLRTPDGNIVKQNSDGTMHWAMPIDTTIQKALRYNEGKLQWSHVDFKSLEPMVRVLEYGGRLYGKDNWRKGHDKTEVLESAMRHLAAIFDGEENDPESGLPHIGHVMCNAMFYQYNVNKNNGQ